MSNKKDDRPQNLEGLAAEDLAKPLLHEEPPIYDSPRDRVLTSSIEVQQSKDVWHEQRSGTEQDATAASTVGHLTNPALFDANPFADLVTDRDTSIHGDHDPIKTHLQMPSRNLAYPQRNPMSMFAIPPDDQRHLLSESYNEKEAYHNNIGEEDKEEEQGDPKVESNGQNYALISDDRPVQKSGLLRRFWSVRRNRWFGSVFLFICSIGLVFASLSYYVSYGFEQPKTHWRGTLSDATGVSTASGFNFTQHINLGITNGNPWPMTMFELHVHAQFNKSTVFGYGRDSGFNMILPSSNHRNATMPMQMNFVYDAAMDRDHVLLKSLYASCIDSHRLPLELFSRGMVKVWRRGMVSVPMGRMQIDLVCDRTIMDLLQDAMGDLSFS